MEYSVVIPVYNEEASLAILQERLNKARRELPEESEVVYVNDGSIDKTSEILREIARNMPEVKIVTLSKNLGKSSALRAGFKTARGKWIITLDADLQNHPEDIVTLLRYKDNFDFIGGIRVDRKDPFTRMIASGIARFFRMMLLGDTTRDMGCGLTVFRREILDTLVFFRNFHRFFTYLVRIEGFSIKEVPVLHSPRRFGQSHSRILKRGVEGVFDLFGVLWLKSRLIKKDDQHY